MTSCHSRRVESPGGTTLSVKSTQSPPSRPVVGRDRLATTAGDQLALSTKPVLLVVPALALVDFEGASRDLFLRRLVGGARLGSRSCRFRILGRYGAGLGVVLIAILQSFVVPRLSPKGRLSRKS